ncbi:inactive serine/threonine-protein kinase VRK3 [Cololabis saira]|uniref:inactive serine/threonine-protein kinase VRK3 n=1 Tax=Cololabis saira TaxID=129043 RepID=UPI002AD46F25|nr:inactive serine/threonine-protein kinase VRK3 [Cololabis saira]XP_061599886.1 inactive serine/threonine-protein kinase VRK3 [Cololabis saira]XP_061599895.1 inactive serine/threonine-protein kinase VRK3 [Cololabis saira]XP_061599903.1 inactive serine/threonine-protein kinase VRK3 [Cololabis saira]
MPFRFCPQCGTKLQPDFRFCPSCGEKLPGAADEPSPVSSPTSSKDEASVSEAETGPSSSFHESINTTPVSPRPALRKGRNSLRLDKAVKFSIEDVRQYTTPSPRARDAEPKDIGVGYGVSSPERRTAATQVSAELEPTSRSVVKPSRLVRGKSKLSSTPNKEAEDSPSDKTGGVSQTSAVDGSSPMSSPISKSPVKVTGRNKAKRAKLAFAVEPLQEGETLTDTTGNKWKLMKLLSQSTSELLYEVSRPNSKESDHILKLGAKDGRIFNEQNFLQRAAKPASVDKWIKQNKMDFLGIPPCAGFGPHADSYRFVIFPNIGSSLYSIMEENDQLLSEKAVLQLACRLLDALQFIHSHEYVHADINAENIYIKPGQKSQVYLVGYCHAFRYRPAGQHVEYREASRTPHEGTLEFISLEAHKGAAPSCRSDLQSLGYCMLRWHTGMLPWTEVTQPDKVATQKQRYKEDVSALLKYCFGKKKVSCPFQTYLTAVMALEYSEEPDYSALKAGLTDGLQQLGGSVELPLCL